jgi:pseudouridine synthase
MKSTDFPHKWCALISPCNTRLPRLDMTMTTTTSEHDVRKDEHWWRTRQLLEQRAALFMSGLSSELIQALVRNPDRGLVAAVAAAAIVNERSVWRAAASLRPNPSFFHFVFNKPAGVLSQPNQFGRPEDVSVHDALPSGYPRVPFAGRLDADTEGLLFFSDDGKLLQALAEPHAEPDSQPAATEPEVDCQVAAELTERRVNVAKTVTKTYHVEVEFLVPDLYSGCEDSPAATLERRVAAVACMARPLNIKGTLSTPAEVCLVPRASLAERGNEPHVFWVSVVLRQGLNRQVRRLCRRAGLRVRRLVRVAFGQLLLGSLAPGQARALTAAEVSACYAAAGLVPVASLPCPVPPQGAELVAALALLADDGSQIQKEKQQRGGDFPRESTCVATFGENCIP